MIDPLELATRHLGFQRDNEKHKNIQGDQTVCKIFKWYCGLVTSHLSETHGTLCKKSFNSRISVNC